MRHSTSTSTSTSNPVRVIIILAGVAFAAFVYWVLPGFGVSDYPKGWSPPRLMAGNKGGCPDLSGSYDDVDDVVPRLLQGGPAWVQGGRSWFEHKAVVTQAPDGSWLEMQFALNERGLPKHREHVMTYNQGWPHGDRLVLKRDVDYRCEGRWLRPTKRPDVLVGKNRAGEMIIGEARQVSGQFSYGNISFGPESVARTFWIRWLYRPASAEARMQAASSFEVNRYRWSNKNGSEIVVKIANYMGEDLCVRIWDVGAARADDKSANAPSLTGTIDDGEGCPAAWLRMPNLGNDNFGLRIPNVLYRIAWRRLADPDAAPTIIDVPRPADLALMPDQDEERRKRAIAGMTPQQLADARARERQREQERARERAEQEQRARALASAPRFASEASIRERIQSLDFLGARIVRVTLADGRARISGSAKSNAEVSKLMRAIDERDSGAAVELASIRQDAGRMHFEILIKPCSLTEL